MSRRRTKRSERGVVLLLVLWVFMTLGVLALDFSTEMRDDAGATMNLSDQTRAYYTAVAGLNRALYENTLERRKNPNGALTNAAATAANVNGQNVPQDQADLDGDGLPDTTIFKPDGKWHPDAGDPIGWF